MSARSYCSATHQEVKPIWKVFCGPSGRGDEASVAALPDLEDFTDHIPGLERERLVPDDFPVKAYGAAPDEATRLAVGAGETGEGNEIHYPDFAVSGQLDLGNSLRHLAANDGVEGPLGLGCSVLAVEHPDDGTGELALLLDRLDVRHRTVEQERVVVGHQVVGDVHDLPEHLVRWIRDADVVAQGLAHLHGAVGADEERGGEDALGSLAIVFHQVAPH